MSLMAARAGALLPLVLSAALLAGCDGEAQELQAWIIWSHPAKQWQSTVCGRSSHTPGGHRDLRACLDEVSFMVAAEVTRLRLQLCRFGERGYLSLVTSAATRVRGVFRAEKIELRVESYDRSHLRAGMSHWILQP